MPSKVPQEAVDLIHKALQVNPAVRISSKEFVEHPWFVKNGIIKPQPSYQAPSQGLGIAHNQAAIRGSGAIQTGDGRQAIHNRSTSREAIKIADHITSPHQQVTYQPGLMPSTTVPNFFTYKDMLQNQAALSQSNHAGTITASPKQYNHQTFTQALQQSPFPKPIFEAVNKDVSMTSESKQNISTDILSNDASRIQRGTPALMLRSNSRSNLDALALDSTAAREYHTPLQISQQIHHARSPELQSTPVHGAHRGEHRLNSSGNQQAGTGGYLDQNQPQSASRQRDPSPLSRPLFVQQSPQASPEKAMQHNFNKVNDYLKTSMVQPPPMIVHRLGAPASLTPVSIRSTPPPNSVAQALLSTLQGPGSLPVPSYNGNNSSANSSPQQTEAYRPLLPHQASLKRLPGSSDRM